MRSLVASSVLVALLLAPRAASAQLDCQGPATEEAMRIFQAGLAAGEAGRWEAALEYFEQSYVMSCAAAALHNRGMALIELRRYVEARDNFARLLEQELSPEVAAEVRAAHADATAQIGILAISGDEGELALDGVAVGAIDGARLLEVDPGPHAIELSADGGTERWRGVVEPGARVAVTLRLELGERSREPALEAGPSGPDLLVPAALLAVGGVIGVAAIPSGVLALERRDALAPMCVEGSCPEDARALGDELFVFSVLTDTLVGVGAAVAVAGLVWLIVELSSGAPAADQRARLAW